MRRTQGFDYCITRRGAAFGLKLFLKHRLVVRFGCGERVSAFVALVFAEDPARWTPASRFIVRAQSEADGRFSIIGLPAGRYRAAALDALDYGDERDPELLSRLKSKAAPIAIRDGESVTLTLPLVTF